MTPATVIGGYLGAGKTTLINQLLREANGRRIAVLVNDFGELTIDADLIEGADGTVMALAGGCVCCSFGADLIGTLQEVLQRGPKPDHVLVESSGVALPASVARTVRLVSALRLESVLVMVDAETVKHNALDPYVGDLIRQQLGEADLLIANKAELRTPTQLDDLKRWLSDATFAQAPIVCTTRAQVPIELVLGFKRSQEIDSPKGELPLAKWAARAIGMPPIPASERFLSEFISLAKPVQVQQLVHAMTKRNAGVVRAKGWLTDVNGQRYLLQMVGSRTELTLLTQQPLAARPDRLLIIGLATRYRVGQFNEFT